jgi:hypothetical protein
MSAESGQYVRHHADARCEIGQEGVGSRLREAPSDVDGLLAGGQRLLAAPEVGEHGPRVIHSGEARRGARHASGIKRLAVVPPAIWLAKVQASISGTALADHPMTQVDASVHRAV